MISPPIRMVVFAVASGCNVRCRMCQFDPDGPYMDGSFRVNLAEFKAAWEPALPYLSRATIRLEAHGGDVMVHPQIGDMLTYILPHVGSVSLLTNGKVLHTLPESALGPKVAMTISIEAADAGRHEAIMCGADWSTLWPGIDRAVSLGARFAVNQCLLADNADQVVPLIALAAEHGCWSFRLIHPAPNHDGECLGLPADNALAAVKIARSACDQHGVQFFDSVTPYVQRGTVCMPSIRVHQGGAIFCPAAFERITYRRDGYVRCPACTGRRVIGQLPMSLPAAFAHPDLIATRQALLAGEPDKFCQVCLARNRVYERDSKTGEFLYVTDTPHPYEDYAPAEHWAAPFMPRSRPQESECYVAGSKERKAVESIPGRVAFFQKRGVYFAECDVLDVGAGPVPLYAAAFLAVSRSACALDTRTDAWPVSRLKSHTRLLATIDRVMADVPGSQPICTKMSRLSVRRTWPDQWYGFVFCNSALEHVADWRSLLANALDRLTPGGVFWLSWAPWAAWHGAHTSGRATHWNHLLMPESDFAAWLDARYDIGEQWLKERHAGPTYVNHSLAVGDVERFFAHRADVEVLSHHRPLWKQSELDQHPRKAALLAVATTDDLLCRTDNWLVRLRGKASNGRVPS